MSDVYLLCFFTIFFQIYLLFFITSLLGCRTTCLFVRFLVVVGERTLLLTGYLDVFDFFATLCKEVISL
jgi:hypothetical protein